MPLPAFLVDIYFTRFLNNLFVAFKKMTTIADILTSSVLWVRVMKKFIF